MDAENTVNGIVTGVVGTLIVGAALPFLVATPGIPVWARGALVVSLAVMDAFCRASPLLADGA